MSQLLSCFACAVCLCCCACLTAAQSRWSLIGEGPGSLIWYLDRRFVRREPRPAAWEKVVLSDGSSIVALIEWDCAARRKRLLQSNDYDPDGMTVRQQLTPLTWRFVIPDSAEETTFKIICANAPETAKRTTARSSAARKGKPTGNAPPSNRKMRRRKQ